MLNQKNLDYDKYQRIDNKYKKHIRIIKEYDNINERDETNLPNEENTAENNKMYVKTIGTKTIYYNKFNNSINIMHLLKVSILSAFALLMKLEYTYDSNCLIRYYSIFFHILYQH